MPSVSGLRDPLPVARCRAEVLRHGRTPHVNTVAIPAVRLCPAACAAGVDIWGRPFYGRIRAGYTLSPDRNRAGGRARLPPLWAPGRECRQPNSKRGSADKDSTASWSSGGGVGRRVTPRALSRPVAAPQSRAHSGPSGAYSGPRAVRPDRLPQGADWTAPGCRITPGCLRARGVPTILGSGCWHPPGCPRGGPMNIREGVPI